MTDNVYTAWLAVMKECGYVQKDGKIAMKGGGYKITTEGNVLRTIRPVLLENGLIILPTDCKVKHDGDRASVEMTYLLHHVPSKTEVTLAMGGMGQDRGDKAVAKAVTHSGKYLLLKGLLVETGDDPDKERPEEQPAGTRGSEVQDAAADHAAHERHTLVNEFNAEYKRIGTPLAKAAIKAHFQGSQWDTSKVHIDTLKKVVAAMNDTVVAPGGTE